MMAFASVLAPDSASGVTGGVYDAKQSDKGIEKRGEWIAILFYMIK